MSLITRSEKGSKLTIAEMDGNLLYLQSLAQAGATSSSSQWISGEDGITYDRKVGVGSLGDYPFTITSDGVNNLYGFIQAGIQGTDSEVGIAFDNLGDNGRSWSLFSTNDASDLGGSKFFINDATMGVSRLTIDQHGWLGIGTTEPQALLHVYTQNQEILSLSTNGDFKIFGNDGNSQTLNVSLDGVQTIKPAVEDIGEMGSTWRLGIVEDTLPNPVNFLLGIDASYHSSYNANYIQVLAETLNNLINKYNSLIEMFRTSDQINEEEMVQWSNKTLSVSVDGVIHNIPTIKNI